MSKDKEILVVEENLAESEHLKHILEQHAYLVSVEHNAKVALDLLRANPPQIVISAVLLPEMDGYQLCREIKADEQLKHIPVILLTSLSDAADIIRGMECGADNFVTKPYDEELLISRIEYILLNRELRASAGAEVGVEFLFRGEKYSITPERQQIVDLLLSTYETAVQKNIELERVQAELNRLNTAQLKKANKKLQTETSERKRAEQSLIESKEHYQRIVETAQEGIWMLDEQANTNYVNERMAEILGYTADEMLGRSMYDFMDDESRVEAEKNFQKRQRGIKEKHDFRFRRKDGTDLWAIVSTNPIISADNVFVGVVGLVTDITKRKLMEEKLRENEEWLRAILDASRDGVIVEDDGIIVYTNKAEAILFGYDTPEELLGKDIFDLVQLADKELMTEYSAARIKGEARPTIYEFNGRRKDGSSIELEATVSISNVAGKKYITTTTRDITERKKAEREIKTSEQRYRALITASAQVVWLADAEGRADFVTTAWQELTGQSLKEARGTGWLDALHPESRKQSMRLWRQAVENKTIYEDEQTVRTRDGSYRVFFTCGVPIFNDNGEILEWIGTLTDITDRKQAEESQIRQMRESALRASVGVMLADSNAPLQENLTRCAEALVEHLDAAFARIWTLNEENDILELQASAGIYTHIDGAHSRVPVGQFKIGLIAKERKPHITNDVVNDPHIGDREWARQNGLNAFAGYPLIIQGRLMGVIAIFATHELSDHTLEAMASLAHLVAQSIQRKQAEEALRASERRFRELVEMLPIAVYTCNLSGGIEGYNKSAVELWGREPNYLDIVDSFCGSYKIYSIDGVFLPHAECPMAQVLRTGKPISNEEIIVERVDGTRRTAMVNVLPRRNEQGNLTGAVNCLVDITDRKQAEEKLHLSEERFQQLQKMEAIGTLTGGVAHDFNNLLTAILGNTQLAQRKLLPNDPIHLRLTEVMDAGNRAAELTRKLLAFSRRQYLERRTINLNDTIGGITMLLERIIGEDIQVSVKYESSLPTVFADPGQIEQVVMNLAVNARDAMPSGGELTIETSCVELDESYSRQYPYVLPGEYIQIRVSDSGTGMDEETQERIFEPYFTTKEVGKGTGLGLSIAFGIIRQHDGHINLYSEPGLGTTFKIYLPVDKKSVKENVLPKLPSFLGGTETILVAEDEEPLRNLAKGILEELGYTVLLAKNGEEAVEIFSANRERIDLFLSDVVMPQMGGSEAFERICEMGGNVPLIFMTGYSSETVQSRFVKPKKTAEELGAVVIQKPYSLEQLGRAVREVLDKNHKPQIDENAV